MKNPDYLVGFCRPPRKKKGQLCLQFKTNRTGCVGVSMVTRTIKLAAGPVMRRFFSAYVGTSSRAFGIDTLGRSEAFRRAVQCRAEYEARVKAGKEAARAC